MDNCGVFILIYFGLFVIGEARKPSKIFQRSDVVPGEFPYMVSILNNDNYICGGAIISSRHILTAAHCFVNLNETYDDIVIISGAMKNRTFGEIHKVANVTIHNKFLSDIRNEWYNDIAVITVSKYQIIINIYCK